MSEALRCNQCDKVVDAPPDVDWLLVEVLSRHRLWTEPSEYHFCSWECMAAFATVKREGIRMAKAKAAS